MMKSYSGNRLPFACVLCHSKDHEAIENLLELLAGKDLRLCLLDEKSTAASKLKRCCAVLPVLSENFEKADSLVNMLIGADAAEKSIVPLNIDDSVQSDSIGRIFHARNIVFKSKYTTDEELASRLLTAEALKNPVVTSEQKKAAKLVSAAAVLTAAVIALAAGLGIKNAAVEPELPSPEPTSEQNNEFLAITNLTLLGDEMVESRSIWDVCVESRDEDGNVVWLKKEDGSVVGTGTSDLSFLQYMPNLTNLVLINQTATSLPDLSGCKRLYSVEIWNCEISDVSALKDTPVSFVHVTSRISDYSQFNELSQLIQLDATDEYGELKTLEGFAPPKLTRLQIHSDTLEDISALGNCDKLISLELRNLKARDFSSIGKLKNLSSLDIEYCDNCRDLSCLSECKKLTSIHLQDLWNLNGDLSCLKDHERLTDMQLFCRLNSLDFLETLPLNGSYNLGFCDNELNDFDGLQAIKKYNSLHVNLNSRDVGLVLPYLADAQIQDLQLYNCNGVDFAALPKVGGCLSISYGDLENLEGLPKGFGRLELDNMQRLTSLNGLKDSDVRNLRITGCPRLTDMEDLYANIIGNLYLRGVYTLPDFSRLHLGGGGELGLESIEGLDSLDCLNGLSDEISIWKLSLIGLDDVTNLKPVERLKGKELVVSPQLADQAQAIVDSGCFNQMSIEYPDTSWMNDNEFTLLSLEELDTLPDALLARVSRLTLVGDTVVDEDSGYYWWADYSNDKPRIFICGPDGEETEVSPSGHLTDFSKLSKLTGLRRISLESQPLTSLEGIQNLRNLEELRISDSFNLEDISPAFAVTSLRVLDLSDVNIRSIEGIQNLRNLRELGLSNCNAIEDFSPLSALEGEFDGFNMCSLPMEDWKDYMTNVQPRSFVFLGCFRNQEDLEYVCAAYPDLERLDIKWNECISDLSPVLEMRNLKSVAVTGNMGEAITSLEGKDYSFELEIEE